jgi:hypothetical protein
MGIPKISGERHQGCIQGKPEKVDDTVEGYSGLHPFSFL